MMTKKPPTSLTDQIKDAFAEEQGLSVKDLADRLKVNRQFMAGVLAVLELPSLRGKR